MSAEDLRTERDVPEPTGSPEALEGGVPGDVFGDGFDETIDVDCLPENLNQERGFTAPVLDFPPDPELLAQGWERRFMADPIRAEESAELYRSLGFEVLSQPVRPTELSAECSDCKLVVCRAYVTIYTRKG